MSQISGPKSSITSTVSDNHFRPFRVSEISPGSPWPEYVRKLLSDPVAEDAHSAASRKFCLSEVMALLCHAALVELGFVPFPPPTSAGEICALPNEDRIRRFSRQVDKGGYNSEAAVFAWKYCVVNITENDVEASQSGKFHHSFSSPCSIIMIPKGIHLEIFCNFGGPGVKPFQRNMVINTLEYINVDTETESLEFKRCAEDWMRVLNFHGIKFYSYFKTNFAAVCLDAMNGLIFDQRGLVCLPPEVIVRIFAHSDIKSIRNFRLTCKYLNDVANIPWLWRTLIRRDFGIAPTVPATTSRFARSFGSVPYPLSQNILCAQQDYKSIYEAHMRVSVRVRFDAMSGLGHRLGGRNSWLPYVTPPRPYILRLSRDAPLPPSAASAHSEICQLMW